MSLKNDIELQNTRQKLEGLQQLIEENEKLPAETPPARDISLKGMRRWAEKLRAEIEEYERSHQTA